ncbi:MAG: hypothetical protein QXG17_03685 [Sulfolobales archaeon]
MRTVSAVSAVASKVLVYIESATGGLAVRKGLSISIPLRKRVINVLLCSTVLMLVTLALGYLVEEVFLVVALASFSVVCSLALTSGRHYGGLSEVFVDLVSPVLLGVFMYLTAYYLIAGLYVGHQVGFTPAEYLLASIRLGLFITQYVFYVITFIVVSSLLMFLIILLHLIKL